MVQTTQIGRKLAKKRAMKARMEWALLPRMPSRSALFYETATPQEWITAFNEWAASHDDLPRVPVSAFSREADYEDHD